MRRQKFVLFPCLYIEPFELVIEIVFHYCIMPPCFKINLFKRPFRGSRFERLDNVFVLRVSLIFLYPQKILISVTCKSTNNAKNATHYVKLGKKRRKSSKRNYYIISPRVMMTIAFITFKSSLVPLFEGL